MAGDFAKFNGFKAYLAGPPAMVNTMVEMLVGRGLRREDIHADPFYTEAEKTAQDMTADLKVSRDAP